MKELSDILSAMGGLSEPAVLVTVVAVEGSTYRRPGARMLASPALPGGRIGSISGGCLEDEVCRRAMYLTDKGPSIVTYTTGLDDGAGPGYTIGCGGRVAALFERVGPGLSPAYLSFMQRNRAAGCDCAVATVIEPGGDLRLADRPVCISETGESEMSAGGESLRSEATEAIRAGCSGHTSLGAARLLLEVIPAPVHLYIFGTGHDAEPVAVLASRLGWRVTIVGKKTRFPCECIALDQAAARLSDRPARRTAAIVMNHNYALDSEAIGALLGTKAAYIGILGPRHRTDAMLSDVASIRSFDAAGIAARIDLSRVHAPIGLDIGAETAEEVALAIIAEIQAFFAACDGGRLRDRPGAIHPPVSTTAPPNSPVIQAACPVEDSP